MYRRKQSGSGRIFLIVIVGIVLGVVYFFYDSFVPPPSPLENLVFLPTSTPVAAPAAAAPLAAASSPTPLPVPTNEPSVLLVISKANVGAKVVHVFLDDKGSWDVSHLGANVGQLEGTAWLNHPGNIGLVGHVELRDGSLGIFAHLKDLKTGDQVLFIESGSAPRVYKVDAIQSVQPDDMSVLYPTANDKLTLITCDDYDFVSNTYFKRTVVTASRVS